MLNIEVLLVEKFLGFYNENLPDIKNYLYISWVLWAYLVEKQKTVIAAYPGDDLPFYGKLPTDCHAITLNYTSFLERRQAQSGNLLPRWACGIREHGYSRVDAH